MPQTTSSISPNTEENSSSRVYWRSAVRSNHASSASAGSSRSNTARAITVGALSWMKRENSSLNMGPPCVNHNPE